MKNLINCYTANGNGDNIPKQCEDCLYLKSCFELGVLKEKPCSSRTTENKAYDILADFKNN